MNIDGIINAFREWLDKALHFDWLSTAVVIVIIVAVTAVVSHLVTAGLRRVLRSNKGPLPSVSIFVNIGRVVVWAVGASVILSSCFGVNVGAAITALGIGGIAISLGFQQTLSNLIGGLQVIMTGLVEPGDRIKVGANEGVVQDVTWRSTTIASDEGNEVIIPNSVINSEALTKIKNPVAPAVSTSTASTAAQAEPAPAAEATSASPAAASASPSAGTKTGSRA